MYIRICLLCMGTLLVKLQSLQRLREMSIIRLSFDGLFILKEKGGYLAFISALMILTGCILIKIFFVIK